MIESKLKQIVERIASAGGRALLVGGFVRDRLRAQPSKDYDLEVYGLTLDQLHDVLEQSGPVIAVGRAFGVLRVKGIDADFSIPRRDNKQGPGHRGFVVELDPSLDFAAAARRRDLTINAIGLDPLSGEILDPFQGQADLARGILRATDEQTFAEDPLRALRVAQFAARFEMQADPALVALCQTLDLSELAGERIYEEFRKLLLKGRRPSLGLQFMRDAELLRFFPELAALVGTPQDPKHHAEGDVWVHTLCVLDAAVEERSGDEDDDLALMFGALCHDIGKPETTELLPDGKVTSYDHENVGQQLCESLLGTMRAPKELIARVQALIGLHGAPLQLVKQGATPRAYRRLARRIADGRITPSLLLRLVRADQRGRDGDVAGRLRLVDTFWSRLQSLGLQEKPPIDVVKGSDLIARGLQPGPRFKEILAACRDLQDKTGLDDAEQILARVLGDSRPDS
ncbi:MAG: HDIG domain-containing protein [Deltaproteobacteria bacterium]|nr:HDIG domain-containing protein [Deltaproteobacteria bacterium]